MPSISGCDVMGSKLFSQFAMHTQLLQSQRASGAVGPFVHTQVIIPDFIRRNCRSCHKLEDSKLYAILSGHFQVPLARHDFLKGTLIS